MSTEPTCPGRGQCHGSMKWCPECGDAAALVCPHSETGCAAHPSRASLCDDIMTAETNVWTAEAEHEDIRVQVAALRTKLAPLEQELARRDRHLRRAVGARDEAKERWLRALQPHDVERPHATCTGRALARQTTRPTDHDRDDLRS